MVTSNQVWSIDTAYRDGYKGHPLSKAGGDRRKYSHTDKLCLMLASFHLLHADLRYKDTMTF